jgi:hypothetical protein
MIAILAGSEEEALAYTDGRHVYIASAARLQLEPRIESFRIVGTFWSRSDSTLIYRAARRARALGRDAAPPRAAEPEPEPASERQRPAPLPRPSLYHRWRSLTAERAARWLH